MKGAEAERGLVPNSVNPDAVEFEKVGGQWMPKPAFPVDADRVNRLAEDLAHLTAEKLVTKDEKLKAAFDAEAKKTGLTIDVVIEGPAGPLQLTVVNLTGDKPDSPKGYYAMSPNSPNLPGEIFQAPPGLFDGPMTGSTYFKKP